MTKVREAVLIIAAIIVGMPVFMAFLGVVIMFSDWWFSLLGIGLGIG